MPDTPQALADRLREEGARVFDFFNNLTKAQWEVQVYPSPSDWSLHHLLAHFTSSEIGRKTLVQYVLSGGEGASSDFDIDIYNKQEVEKLIVESTSFLLQLFLKERDELVTLVSSLEIDDLNRMGYDPYLGAVPLLEIIKLTYRHLQIHLRDARRCL
jgi:DinB superfamily